MRICSAGPWMRYLESRDVRLETRGVARWPRLAAQIVHVAVEGDAAFAA